MPSIVVNAAERLHCFVKKRKKERRFQGTCERITKQRLAQSQAFSDASTDDNGHFLLWRGTSPGGLPSVLRRMTIVRSTFTCQYEAPASNANHISP